MLIRFVIIDDDDDKVDESIARKISRRDQTRSRDMCLEMAGRQMSEDFYDFLLSAYLWLYSIKL